MNLTPKQTIKGTVAEAQSLKGTMKDIPSVDNTLTKEGYAADAKAVGEALNTKAPISHTEDKGNPHGVTASQVGARPDTWMPSASEIGAAPIDSVWTATDPNNDGNIIISGGTASGGCSADAVLYTEQSLTEEQQAQARENIGAVSAEEFNLLNQDIETALDAIIEIQNELIGGDDV